MRGGDILFGKPLVLRTSPLALQTFSLPSRARKMIPTKDGALLLDQDDNVYQFSKKSSQLICHVPGCPDNPALFSMTEKGFAWIDKEGSLCYFDWGGSTQLIPTAFLPGQPLSLALVGKDRLYVLTENSQLSYTNLYPDAPIVADKRWGNYFSRKDVSVHAFHGSADGAWVIYSYDNSGSDTLFVNWIPIDGDIEQSRLDGDLLLDAPFYWQGKMVQSSKEGITALSLSLEEEGGTQELFSGRVDQFLLHKNTLVVLGDDLQVIDLSGFASNRKIAIDGPNRLLCLGPDLLLWQEGVSEGALLPEIFKR